MHDVDAKQTLQRTREAFLGRAIAPHMKSKRIVRNPNAAESERLTPWREGRTS
jgi:hypothetical protein